MSSDDNLISAMTQPPQQDKAFQAFVVACAQNTELVAEFDRLAGTQLLAPASALHRAIDEASGRWASDNLRFMRFCADMWSRLPNEARKDIEHANL